MEIIYKNYRIKCDKGDFTLYSFKADKNTVIGYFTTIRGALVHIYTDNAKKAKKSKKYDKDLLKMIYEYDKINKHLYHLSNLIYKPVKELNEAINGVRTV